MGDRNIVVEMLSDVLGDTLPVAEDPKTLQHLWSIVEVCQRRPNGLGSLLHVLDSVEPGCRQMDDVRELINQMTALEMWPHEERDRLFALLAGVVIPDIADIYRSVGGSSAPPVPFDAANYVYFRALETLNAGTDGLPKALVFVERLADRVRADLAVELRRWADRQADRMELASELHAAREFGRSSVQLTPESRALAYLIMQMQLEGPSGGRYRLSHWKQLDLTDGWHPERGRDVVGGVEKVRRTVAALIEETESEWARYEPDFRLEFVLTGELLNLDVDQWQWETETTVPEPLGCRFPVSVRSLDRMRAWKWHRWWLSRWKELGAQLDNSGAIPTKANRWNVQNGQPDDLVPLLARDPSLLSMVLSEPPSPGSVGAREAEIGLKWGVPVIVWHRLDCDADDFAVAAQELLHGADGNSVLERARLIRANAVAAGPRSNHVGRSLSVLWDDPERIVSPLHVGPPEG
ncbi:hypothetical protein MOQ72_21925 [Saccharopolyspora sp. K220]|nr:hypothetical protein [Saccharopolyspora soli]